jgi:uncharacterized protein (UPF0261 family)/ABC-type branched-subunit amino acid transport system ATPase component
MADWRPLAAGADRRPPPAGTPALEVRGLHVNYGRSHVLQGVDLRLDGGVLAVVGRNGMGKTTLCQTITGLVRAASGSVRLMGEEVTTLAPAQIARLGLGYVPQGRRLWPSLTVDEHLRLAAARGPWTVARIYETFPRLAERRGTLGGQLSGGEQQMLAISRALLMNPRVLVMDEPTEGLAPVIVAQVEEMLLRLVRDGEVAVLLIEQNIGVATEAAETVAIMVNGRINRTIASARLAADKGLQQRLLGVGRHAHEDAAVDDQGEILADSPAIAAGPRGPQRLYLSNPAPPTRWSQPAPVASIIAAARTVASRETSAAVPGATRPGARPVSESGEPMVLVIGTLDTKGGELRFIRDILRDAGLRTRLVDLSTSGAPSGADVPPHLLATFHPRGASGVFTGDRGASVAAMAQAFEAWVRRQGGGIAGAIAAGGSGGTVAAAPGMRALPVGVPKLIVSTMASGNVRAYVGASDLAMMHAVTDVQGLNSLSRQVLANAAHAMAGMVSARLAAPPASQASLPAVGLTMFGVTTPCVQQVAAALEGGFECLTFHANGLGGQAMEALAEEGRLTGVIDVTTTEVCDLLLGGILPAAEDRFGAFIRGRTPYVGSCGALDMVNFGPPETMPAAYAGRLLNRHNPQVTLMRTTPEECARIGAWIGERLNRMDGPVRFLLPEGGLSALDAPGQPFHDREADTALFAALEATVRQTSLRRLERLPHHINDPAFAAALVAAFHGLAPGRPGQRPGQRPARTRAASAYADRVA